MSVLHIISKQSMTLVTQDAAIFLIKCTAKEVSDKMQFMNDQVMTINSSSELQNTITENILNK